MNKEKIYFLIRLTGFLIPIFAIFGLLEWKLRNCPTELDLLRMKFIERSQDIKILVLGTSHMEQGIDPALLSQSSLNASVPIQSLMISARLGQKFVPYMPKLKLVILEVSYFSRDFSYIKTYAASKLFDYSIALGIRENSDWKEWFDIRYLSRYFAMGRHQALSHLKKTESKIDNSIEPEITRPSLDPMGAKMQANYHETLMNADESYNNLSALKELALLLKEHQIPLMLVRTPASQFYRKAINQERMDLVIKDMLQATSAGSTRFFDYFENSTFSESDFYNADHLNHIGREKFSLILNEDIRQNYPTQN